MATMGRVFLCAAGLAALTDIYEAADTSLYERFITRGIIVHELRMDPQGRHLYQADVRSDGAVDTYVFAGEKERIDSLSGEYKPGDCVEIDRTVTMFHPELGFVLPAERIEKCSE